MLCSVSCRVRSSRIRVALICVRLITLPVSIDILQIHPHAQLAHWAFVTLTTVVNHCWRITLVNVLPTFCLFEPFIFRKEKSFNKITRSWFLFYPNPCHAWVLNISRLISSSLYSNSKDTFCFVFLYFPPSLVSLRQYNNRLRTWWICCWHWQLPVLWW
jgi:hypothetical protein